MQILLTTGHTSFFFFETKYPLPPKANELLPDHPKKASQAAALRAPRHPLCLRRLQVWRDPSGLQERYKAYHPLSQCYPDALEPFFAALEVPAAPTFPMCLRLLRRHAELGPGPGAPAAAATVGAALDRLAALLREGAPATCGGATWAARCADARVFPGRDGSWRAPPDAALLVDDVPGVAGHLRGAGYVFADLPAPRVPEWAPALRALGFTLLSARLTRAVAPAGARPDGAALALLDGLLPHAQAYLRHHRPAVYRSLVASGVARTLRELVVYRCDELHVVWRLDGHRTPALPRDCVHDGRALYHACAEVAGAQLPAFFGAFERLVTGDDGEADPHFRTFLAALARVPPEERAEYVRAVHGFAELPPDEAVWAAGAEGPAFGAPPSAALAEGALAVQGDAGAEGGGPALADSASNAWDGPGAAGLADQAFDGAEAGGWARAGAAEGAHAARDRRPAPGEGTWEAAAAPGDVALAAADALERPPRDAADVARADVTQLLSTSARAALGRWGEEAAFLHLRKEFPEAAVEWVNREHETGEPYDIVVRGAEGRADYYEVKTTKAGDKDIFEISSREWGYAQEQGPRFHVLRIYNAGRATSRVEYLHNPYGAWAKGRLQLYILM